MHIDEAYMKIFGDKIDWNPERKVELSYGSVILS